MEVLRGGDLEPRKATAAIFIGDVEAAPLVSGTDSRAGVTLVRFLAGARNHWHTHTRDQVLYFTEGRGIVADRDGERLMSAGDIATIVAGEEHWHGAQPGADAAHLSILLPGETTVLEQ